MPEPMLLNAARAFAMVSFADGRLSLEEEEQFGKLIASDAEIPAAPWAEAREAWLQAVDEVRASPSFGPQLAALRAEIKTDADKRVIMRIAQAAAVADERVEPQENTAIRLLAEALGLDPDAY